VAQGQPANDQIHTLQYLRALAALLVVFNHCEQQVPGMPQLFPDELWASGVDIFFVISGFVITGTTDRREGQSVRFLLERLARIVPLYWLFTLLNAALMIGLPSLFRRSEFSLDHLLLSLAFVPHEHPVTGTFSPILRIGWTLLFEMHFYLLFAVAIFIDFRRRLTIVASVLIALALLGWVWMPASAGARFYVDSIALEFLFGVALAVAWRRGWLNLPPILGFPMLIGGLALLGVLGTLFGPEFKQVPRALAWGLPATLATAGVLVLHHYRWRTWRLGLLTGDASYALYLVHLFPITLMRVVWVRLGLPHETIGASIGFHLACIVVAVLCSYVVYWTFDKPVHQFLKGAIARLAPGPGRGAMAMTRR